MNWVVCEGRSVNRSLHTESEIFVPKFLHVKNKYDHVVSITFAHCLRNFRPSKKFGSGSIFCVFASVACILIGKDGEYEKKEKRMRKFQTQCAMALRGESGSIVNGVTRLNYVCSVG